MRHLHPEIDARLGWAHGVDPAQLMTDPELRSRLSHSYFTMDDEESPVVKYEQFDISNDECPYPVSIRLYRTQSKSATSAVVLVHGGGFLGGTVDDQESDGVAREIVTRTGAAVVSVDYRLASQEHHFPHLHHEVLAAFKWTCSPGGLELNPASVVLLGASAGASLCATATLELRERSDELPAGLVLLYPLLFKLSPPADSPYDIDRVPAIFRILQPSVEFMFDSYLGPEALRSNGVHGSLDDETLDGLPPSLVVAAAYDDLAGHAHEFASRATRDGSVVRLIDVPGMPHGFLQLPRSIDQVGRSLEAIATFVDEQTGPR
ncbi:alpha/beta hydrolase [Demequina globuliformis]|uniref:alpha/beta hydrolase n=1 Tax=Demequina globuliformis TaxID=676202 RepID=UPI000782FDD8|nr:alpha/beta hydrolase [Demequina globuliformis]